MSPVFKPGVRLPTKVAVGGAIFCAFVMGLTGVFVIGFEVVRMEQLRSQGTVVRGVVSDKRIEDQYRARVYVVAYSFALGGSPTQEASKRMRGQASVSQEFYESLKPGQEIDVTVILDDPDASTAGRVDSRRVWRVPLRRDNLFPTAASLTMLLGAGCALGIVKFKRK